MQQVHAYDADAPVSPSWPAMRALPAQRFSQPVQQSPTKTGSQVTPSPSALFIVLNALAFLLFANQDGGPV